MGRLGMAGEARCGRSGKVGSGWDRLGMAGMV